MEIQKQKIISIAFLDDETTIIQNIFIKLHKEISKPGYTKPYNKDERSLILRVNEELNDSIQVQQVSSGDSI